MLRTQVPVSLLFALLSTSIGLPASAQYWHSMSVGGGAYLLFSPVNSTPLNETSSLAHSVLFTRCGGSMPPMPYFLFPPLETSDSLAVQMPCQEDNDYCSERGIPIRILIDTIDGQTIAIADTAGIKDNIYLYPRNEDQRVEWLHLLNSGDVLSIAFDWYQDGIFDWNWPLTSYHSLRDKHCK